MQIVIEMQEDDYISLKEQVARGIANPLKVYIATGTPLPNGHGDLIDRKALIESGIYKGFCDWYSEIKYAPTIVEADKVESEEEE